MTLVFIRCTTHRDLSHAAFAHWLEKRRAELTRGTGGVRHINVGRLGSATWVLELHGIRAGDRAFASAVAGLLADLRLLGTQPACFAPADGLLDGAGEDAQRSVAAG